MREPVYVGADAVPAIGSELQVVCADACGLDGDRPGRLVDAPAPGGSAGRLLEQEAVRARIAATATAVVVWKPSVRIAEAVRQAGVPLANAAAATARRLENKVHFARTAPDAWLPVPPAVTGVAGAPLVEAALGLRGPWVVQLASGYGGRSTALAGTRGDLERIIGGHAGRTCRVSTWIEGDAVTVTGVVGDDAVALGDPCRQATGIPLCTPHPLGSCGNDFGGAVRAADAIGSVAARAAAWLQREGHRGIFGADLVVAPDGTVFCIEVNPRLVASVPLWNLSARDRGEPSLLARHLGVFAIGAAGPLPARLGCHWSQLILHNLGAHPVGAALASGVGPVTPGGAWERTGPLRLRGPDPGEAAVVVRRRAGPGQELARIVLEGPCLDDRGDLLPRAAALVAAVRARLAPA